MTTTVGRTPEYRGIRYRTLDGQFDFEFTFTWIPATASWRVYIDDRPGYGSLSATEWDTHRIREGAHTYICWTDRLTTLRAAQQVAAMWAEATAGYLRTGRFPAPTAPADLRLETGIASFDACF